MLTRRAFTHGKKRVRGCYTPRRIAVGMRRHRSRVAANIELQSVASDKSAVRELPSAAQGRDPGHAEATES